MERSLLHRGDLLVRKVREACALSHRRRCIRFDRRIFLGDPKLNFGRIARLWNAYTIELSREWARKEGTDPDSFRQVPIYGPEQVADMMILLKLARDMGPGDCPDNMDDLMGYALIKRRLKYSPKADNGEGGVNRVIKKRGLLARLVARVGFLRRVVANQFHHEGRYRGGKIFWEYQTYLLRLKLRTGWWDGGPHEQFGLWGDGNERD